MWIWYSKSFLAVIGWRITFLFTSKIREKVYGKQKVYVIDQSHFPEVDESGVKSMDEQISQLNGRVQLKGEEVRKLESEVKTFDGMISTGFQFSFLIVMTIQLQCCRGKVSRLNLVNSRCLKLALQIIKCH